MWGSIRLAGARRISAVKWSVSVQDKFGNMLFDPLLQPLGSITHVSSVTVTQKLVDNIAMTRSRKYIFVAC